MRLDPPNATGWMAIRTRTLQRPVDRAPAALREAFPLSYVQGPATRWSEVIWHGRLRKTIKASPA
jgi:hypothetical protein